MPHEFDGEAYKQSSNHQKEWGNRIIAEFELNGNEHILDLGCGDGALTAQLAELVPEGWVLGIDASRGMIDVAGKLRKTNLEFKLLDIDSLDYYEEFDLVFSNATLHWVKDHRRLLANSYRCLKKTASSDSISPPTGIAPILSK
jgi:trans-aconitate methyltransferase